jgi:uncharacterized protein (DUF4415 family)
MRKRKQVNPHWKNRRAKKQALKKTAQKASKRIIRLQASSGELPATPNWQRYFKAIKEPVTLRLDADILAWYRKQGRGYQTRINRALRKSMTEERRMEEGKNAGE